MLRGVSEGLPVVPNGNLVIIGASTGGLKVLEVLFPRLPVLNAAVVIVQHITPVIDQAFVSSLSRVSKMPVTLAVDGQMLQHGQTYLAPGGMHLALVNNQKIRLFHGEKVNSVCPAIDVAMTSATPPVGGKLVGVILTGMGCDGAAGIAHIKRLGGITIAQDQKTSVIYGMPKAALETGAIDFVLPTEGIADKLRDLLSK